MKESILKRKLKMCLQNSGVTYFSYFHIELTYEHPEVYLLMEGKQAYTIENLLGQSGGFLGLMMGASLLSVV